MPREILQKVGTQIVFADHSPGDFSPTAANDLRQGTPTNVAFDFASVTNNSARQSDKVDLGATRARGYSVMAVLEFAATPTAGLTVDLYWASSPTSTAANGNPGGVSGSESAYTGYSSNLDASLSALQFIGSCVITANATATIQILVARSFVPFQPRERYGTLVAVNRSGATMHSDDVEMHIVMTPIIDEVQ